ncbi:MAG: hypothetical protein A4E57_00469 [Syntrophorhabdaceae bacterium PtaU1.Bin034]|nr:MAG: hypothetical protein A4E57_00469 [Syntrophorhabdaceae bacterium PtaU1.Bin034]
MKTRDLLQSGFTLIELILAIVIMGVCGLGFLSVFTRVMAPKNAPQPYEIVTGTELVQEGLERIAGDRRNPDRGCGWIVSGNYLQESLPGGYTRTTSIGAWPPNTDLDNYKQATVIVTKGGKIVGKAAYLVANY